MKLGDYLRQKNVTVRAFAKSIDRAPSTVSRIVRGEQRPDWQTVAEIERATAGRVRANDFAIPLETAA